MTIATITDMTAALRKEENFSFSRWGDGEWKALLHPGSGHNCDGHEYFPTLSTALQRVLLSQPPYVLGIQSFALRRWGDEINAWLEANQLRFDWVDADTLHRASIKDELADFMAALQTRRVVLVAPQRLEPMARRFKAPLVEVPLINAWTACRSIEDGLREYLKPHTVVIYCAGMTANVLIDNLWVTERDSITQLDIGSLFDPFCGFQTRSYHSKIIDRENTR
jgi:hypothetical protein